MVFEGEEVPLTEDIVSKKQEFVKTWLEWVADNKIQIFRVFTGIGTTYEVPKNRVFFMTNAYMNVHDDQAAVGFIADLVVKEPDGSIAKIIIRIKTNPNERDDHLVNLTFPMPIKLEEGQKIDIDGFFPSVFFGGIVGWEDDKIIAKR